MEVRACTIGEDLHKSQPVLGLVEKDFGIGDERLDVCGEAERLGQEVLVDQRLQLADARLHKLTLERLRKRQFWLERRCFQLRQVQLDNLPCERRLR